MAGMSIKKKLIQTSRGARGRVRILAAQSKPFSFIAVRCSVPSPKGVKCTPRPLEGSSTSNVGMRADPPSGYGILKWVTFVRVVPLRSFQSTVPRGGGSSFTFFKLGFPAVNL